MRGGTARADDPARRVVGLGADHQQGPLPVRHPQQERAVRIDCALDGNGELVAKDRCRLLEGHAVLLQVGGGLLHVPGEVHWR
jgi:hypothetical protein